MIALTERDQLGEPAADREHQLRRVRSRKRRVREQRFQPGVSAGGRRGDLRFRRRRVTKARPVATPEPLRQRTASASAASPPHRITWPSAAPISATPPAAPTAITGTPRTAPITRPRSPTFPKFPGTIPAPAACSRIISDYSTTYGTSGFCGSSTGGALLSERGCRERRPQQLRSPEHLRSTRASPTAAAKATPNPPGRPERSRRRCSRSSGCVPVRRGRRIGVTTLYSAGRIRERRRALHRRPQQLGRRRRYFLCDVRLWRASRLW